MLQELLIRTTDDSVKTQSRLLAVYLGFSTHKGTFWDRMRGLGDQQHLESFQLVGTWKGVES